MQLKFQTRTNQNAVYGIGKGIIAIIITIIVISVKLFFIIFITSD